MCVLSKILDEHLGYISDTVRLEHFRQAIALSVRPGDIVLDVGCGFAVLGLMCLEAGAARVYGIDHTDAIEIARETAVRAGFGERYHCIREHSFRAELPEQVDVIICDHVGYFGFDYGIIDILGDARRRFLKPGGRVIPGRIDLQIAGIASAAAREKAMAWSAPPIPAAFHWLEEYGINSRHRTTFSADNVLVPAANLGTIDLSADSPDHFSFTADLIATRSDEVDGLGGWFDCELAMGVRMTNSPLNRGHIDRKQVFLPFASPLAIKPGDTMRVKLVLRHDVTVITWSARNLSSGEQRRQSTWRSQILSEADRSGKLDRVPQLGREGKARRIVLDYIDGMRTAQEIEQAVLRDHPGLFPSADQVIAFVRGELARNMS